MAPNPDVWGGVCVKRLARVGCVLHPVLGTSTVTTRSALWRRLCQTPGADVAASSTRCFGTSTATTRSALATRERSTPANCHPEPRRRQGTSHRPTVTLLPNECNSYRRGGPSSSAIRDDTGAKAVVVSALLSPSPRREGSVRNRSRLKPACHDREDAYVPHPAFPGKHPLNLCLTN